MDAVLAEISKLGQSKRLVQAEEIIMSTIDKLDSFYSTVKDDDQVLKIEKALISLFYINSGELSTQCAIYIASKLLLVYKSCGKAKLWNMLNFAVAHFWSSTIIAAGYLTRHIGETNKSQLPRFVESLLKNGEKYPFATIYALRACFKAGGKTMHQYGQKAFDLVSSFLAASTKQTSTLGLKFLKLFLNIEGITIDMILETARTCLARDSEAPFVRDAVASLVARCAYEPYALRMQNKRTSHSEWTVASRSSHVYDLGTSLEIISAFPTIISRTFIHFTTLLGIETVSLNHLQLVRFVREKIPEDIGQLIPLLPGDSRYTYFREVSKEELSISQLKLLSILCPDDDSIADAAAIAFKIASSQVKRAQNEAAEFFSGVTKTHPFLVEQYLKKALNSKSDATVTGYGKIAKAIISNYRDKETALLAVKDDLSSLLKKSLSQEPNSPGFVSALELLSVCPKSYAVSSYVSKAVDSVMSLANPTKQLVKAVFEFRSRYIKPTQTKKLVQWVFKVCPKLPKSTLGNLCSIIPKTSVNEPIALTATKAIIEAAMVLKPSHTLTKSFLKRPLPLASELVGGKSEPGKYDTFLNTVIRKIPILVASCQQQYQGQLIKSILEPQKQNTTTLLMCASMCESKQTRKNLPINLHKYLLSLLTAKTSSLMQTVCECIALFTKSHPDAFPSVFEYVESHPGAASCLILSSLFSHVIVPTQFMTRTLIFLDSQLKNGATSGVALHAVTSLVTTHSMQLSALGTVASNQFTQLFLAIHRPFSLQPVTMAIIGECFRVLIEAFSSELVIPENPFIKTVILIIKSIHVTPMSYAKEVYYDCCRGIYTFAHWLRSYAPIVFPSSRGSGTSVQLAASEAFAYSLKFQNMEIGIQETVPVLLSLLQRTSDGRAAHFINSLASTLTDEDVSFWVSVARRVLVTSSLIDSSNLAIEPLQCVKKTLVDVLIYVVEEIAKPLILVTEYLDDVVSSLCRATETGSVQLQEAAFPVLQRVITLFKDRVTDEGQRLLDLYDSQFAAVVKVGFQLPLSVSGNFLSTYLTFNTDNMSKDPENCSAILIVYLDSLDGCKERSASYYSLAAHLCSVGRKYSQMRPLIQTFLITMTPIFADVVLQSMSLWGSRNDWRKMNEFRLLARDFYAELLPAFVWLQTISKTVVSVDVLVSFFVIEMKLGREHWMVSAAFEALNVALDFCGNDISAEMLELAMKTAIGFTGTDERQLLINSAALLKPEREWDSLRECILSFVMTDPKRYSSEAFAHLLKSDSRRVLSSYALSIAQFFITKYHAGELTSETTSALFVVLFDHTPSVVIPACDYCIGIKGLATHFKLMIIELGLKKIGKSIPDLGGIPRYLLATFKKGGMHLIGQMMNTKPDIGLILFAKGAAKAAFLLALKDIENVRAYVWFIQLGLVTMEAKIPALARAFAPSVFRFCVKVIEQCANDPLNGRLIVWHCIRVIQDASRIASTLESLYAEIRASERKQLCEILTNHIESEIQNQKMQALVEFSTNERSHRQSEWTTLEIGDSD